MVRVFGLGLVITIMGYDQCASHIYAIRKGLLGVYAKPQGDINLNDSDMLLTFISY
jgi:hypothetical protein